MASAADMQCRRRGSDRGLVGVDCTRDRSQARASLLLLVRAILEAVGSPIRTQVDCRTSDFLRSEAAYLYDSGGG